MRKAILLSATLLAACSNYSNNLPSIKPYKMDVQQGNVVTPKMMMQLRPGMTKAQVRFVMGTPLIADSFHANRWDYFYRMQKDGKVIEQRRVILDFEDEKLLRVRGDVVPAGGGTSDSSPGDRPANKAPATLKSTSDAPKKEEKGMLDKLKFWKSDEPEKAKPVEVQKNLTKPAEAPMPAEDQLPTIQEEKPEALPPLMEEDAPVVPAESQPVVKPSAKSVAQPAPVAKPESTKPTAAPEAKPAVKAAPAPEPRKVEAKPEPKPEQSKPAAKPLPKVEPKAAPKPQDDLPAEDDPSYFERMLEKIGF